MRAADTIGSKIEKVQLTRLARLVYLAPEITTAILEGRKLQHCRRASPSPADAAAWLDEQKALPVFS